jgi:hypothetical protein
MNLFGEPGSASQVAPALDANHYLGRSRRGIAWSDEHGVAVLAPPTSRRLPQHWLELVRWCLSGEPNAGSRQWAAIARWLRADRPDVTTVVSYSDPSVGHTGALYRACGWLWAPTWHRLRPPPSGNGRWTDEREESVKDRWVYLLAPDEAREAVLAVRDAAVVRDHPGWSYREPRWRHGRCAQGGGGDYSGWRDAIEAGLGGGDA